MHTTPRNIHALVRILKAPSDPPSADGPLKIDIANDAWLDASFGAVKKAEVLVEWLLGALGRDGKRDDKISGHGPLSNPKYWALLQQTLSSSASSVRPLKTWLIPLLHRTNLAGMVKELITLSHAHNVDLDGLYVPARAVLAILWPLAEKRVGMDGLMECFAAVLGVCGSWNDDLAWICTTVVASYREVLGTFGNKKKLYTSFLLIHMPHWIRTLSPSMGWQFLNIQSSREDPSSKTPKQLHDTIYRAGIDTLFSVEGLKQPLDTFLDALSRAGADYGFNILPGLFSARLSAVHRCRNTLFSSSSGSTSSVLATREAVRTDAMQFWESCWRVLLCDALTTESGVRRTDAWAALVGVLAVIESERLYTPSSTIRTGDQNTAVHRDTESTLIAARGLALDAVESAGQAWNSNDMPAVTLAVDTLDMFTRIEYELVGDELHRILRAVVNLPRPLSVPATDAVQRLLSNLLDYHAKTRTVHAYILTLLTALSSFSLPKSVSSQFLPLPAHDVVFSPLSSHLSSLTRTLRVALTPTQSAELGPAVLEELGRVWKAYAIERGSDRPSGKRRKIFIEEGTPAEEHIDVGGARGSKCHSLAAAFSLVARVSGTVLASLPSHAYVYDAQHSGIVCDEVGKLGWDIVWESIKHEQGGPQEVASQNQDDSKVKRRKKRKRGGKQQDPDSDDRLGTDEVVASAALRFLYDVRARFVRIESSPTTVTLGQSDVLGGDEIEELLRVVRDESTRAELTLEIIRTLFAQVSQTRGFQHAQASAIIKTSIDLLSRNFSPQSRWCGSSAALTQENLGVALLYMLVDRWLGVTDAVAPEEVLQKFASLLLSIPLEQPFEVTDEFDSQPSSHSVISPYNILLLALRNAQFWELRNMRSAFLTFTLKRTAPLSSFSLLPVSTGPSGPDKLELVRASEVYTLLMYVPPEYFTRTSRAELVKRAVSGDVAICSVLRGANDGGEVDSPQIADGGCDMDMDKESGSEVQTFRELCVRHLTIFRAFLYRMGQFTNGLDYNTSRAYVEHLLQPPASSALSSDALTRETLNLVSFQLSTLLRAQNPEAVTEAIDILNRLLAAEPLADLLSQGPRKCEFVRSVAFRLIGCLREHHIPESLETVIMMALTTLYEFFVSVLLLEGEELGTNDAFALSEHVEARSYALSFVRWLGADIPGGVVPIGIKLATMIMRSVLHIRLPLVGTKHIRTCPGVLALLFEELWCLPDISNLEYLETIAALYSICGTEMEVRNALDIQVAKAARELSIDYFAHLLSVIAEGIEDPRLPVGRCKSLIHLSTILLHDAPQGTLKVVRTFVTRCLDAFTGRPHLCEGPSELKEHYLELIANHCSDRPTALRSVDLGSIWSLLCKILSGTADHDTATSFAIFHYIVSIAGSLVRLRRDIVIHTLPHLAFVLHRLLLITKRARPQLGAKQSKLVAGTLPSWVSPSQPLGIAESRALSRLLTTLTVKTVPRTYTTQQHTAIAAEAQKAESLAQPFAKHVGHVLLAYIDCMNDPLCVLTPEMRRELEPGLFSLCEMLGEYNRDALMVSALDSGGKTIMKSLWREYEKQRYVGKG
ncbi:Urb2/Npa2 family-domain-containing protein [Pisolithus thermaeus]|nr:Urb2/Npa2 family-domain-containing protein [Pisolithus croceorrhizus]KAI6152876.1 Urb2/Npa2 family-domain-containing protein [Pisolithus thermaeus]